MEKAVDNYISKGALEGEPLHPSQHAYRMVRSTKTALYELTENIRNAMDKKVTAGCASLDTTGSFDNVSQRAIQHALEGKMHRLSCLSVPGATRSCPSAAPQSARGGVLEVLLDLAHLHLFVEIVASGAILWRSCPEAGSKNMAVRWPMQDF